MGSPSRRSTILAVDATGPDASGALSLPRILTFSLANLPVTAISIAVFVYLPPYFAGHLGIGMAMVGTAWGLVRMIDIPIDVFLAVMMDRTRTSVGRYRPWMIASTPILMFALYKLFMATKDAASFSLHASLCLPGQSCLSFAVAPYLIEWLLVMYLGNSILLLSTNAWGATLVTLYHERSRLFGGLAAVGVAGALAVLMIPILGHGLGRTNAQSVQAMGWFIILATPLCVAAAALCTPERIAVDHRAEAYPLKDYRQVLVKPEAMRLFLAQMGLTLGPGWMSALYLFFFTAAWGYTVQQASILLAVYIVAGLLGAIAIPALARRIGKHRALMVTTTCFSLGIFAIFATPKGDVLAALPIMIWSGAMAAGFNLMVGAMIADVSDEVRLIQGRERTSLLYAINTLAAKIASAFSILLTFPLLQRLGFNPAEGAVNTPAAIHNLTIAFIAGPIVFVMLGGACVIGWPLDARRQEEIRGALDARDAEQAAANGPFAGGTVAKNPALARTT